MRLRRADVSRETNIGTGADTSLWELMAETFEQVDRIVADKAALCEHVQADHETLRALWALAGHWDTEADAVEQAADRVAWTGPSRERVKTLRRCVAELRDVAAGRQ